MKYLGRENMMSGVAYPVPTAGYLPHSSAIKLLSPATVPGPGTVDGQTIHLSTQMAPIRFRPLHSPPMDYISNGLDRHGTVMMPRSPPSAGKRRVHQKNQNC